MTIDYKKLREATGRSEVDFAKELGVTPELVIAWETRMAFPAAMERKKIFALVKKITERGQ